MEFALDDQIRGDYSQADSGNTLNTLGLPNLNRLGVFTEVGPFHWDGQSITRHANYVVAKQRYNLSGEGFVVPLIGFGPEEIAIVDFSTALAGLLEVDRTRLAASLLDARWWHWQPDRAVRQRLEIVLEAPGNCVLLESPANRPIASLPATYQRLLRATVRSALRYAMFPQFLAILGIASLLSIMLLWIARVLVPYASLWLFTLLAALPFGMTVLYWERYSGQWLWGHQWDVLAWPRLRAILGPTGIIRECRLMAGAAALLIAVLLVRWT